MTMVGQLYLTMKLGFIFHRKSQKDCENRRIKLLLSFLNISVHFHVCDGLTSLGITPLTELMNIQFIFFSFSEYYI